MKTLYEAANAVEAHMLLDLLKQEGMEARIEGEALQGAMGGVPAAGLVRLVVDEDGYAPARALIAQVAASPLRRVRSRQVRRCRQSGTIEPLLKTLAFQLWAGRLLVLSDGVIAAKIRVRNPQIDRGR